MYMYQELDLEFLMAALSFIVVTTIKDALKNFYAPLFINPNFGEFFGNCISNILDVQLMALFRFDSIKNTPKFTMALGNTELNFIMFVLCSEFYYEIYW